ncbi:MAG: alpha/beta fold hydrolase [Streptosporangiaceae bacterium]
MLANLTDYRALLVELPGHGLSGPVAYLPGGMRDHTLGLMDGIFDALGMATAPLVGHSLGGMFALWYAAARPGRIASLVAIGDLAVALPGATVRMPLSLLTLRSPTRRRVPVAERRPSVRRTSPSGPALVTGCRPRCAIRRQFPLAKAVLRRRGLRS